MSRNKRRNGFRRSRMKRNLLNRSLCRRRRHMNGKRQWPWHLIGTVRDANLPIVNKAFLFLLFFGSEANLLHCSFIILFGIGPQRAFRAFRAAMTGISGMIAKMRIILDRGSAYIAHFRSATARQLVATFLLN